MINTFPKVGSEAPDFSLPDQNGAMHSLKDTRGKWTLLYFYPKDDTPGCTKEACSIGELYPDFQKLDAVVFGVSVDPAETPVFNMRVDRHHTYFVGETGYLVHNEKDQDPDGGALGDDIPGSIDDKKRSPPTPKPTPKA